MAPHLDSEVAEADVLPHDSDTVVVETAEDAARRQACTRTRLLEQEKQILDEIEAGYSGDEYETEDAVKVSSAPSSPSRGLRLAPNAIEVSVVGLSGSQLCKVSVDRSFSIRQVKCKVASSSFVPADEQRIFLGNDELKDHLKLAEVTPPTTPSAEFSMLRVDPEWQQTLEVVSYAGMQLAVAPPHLKADRQIVLTAVRQNGNALEFASKEFCEDKALVLDAVCQCGLALEHASEALQRDKEVVKAAVSCSWGAFRFASEELQGDRDIVLAAVLNGFQAFQFASEDLRKDREFVQNVLAAAGLCLEFAAPILQADRDIVLAAVRQDGLALEFASEELRADREVVLEAVRVNGLALWDADECLRTDPEILASCRWG
eukprot:TRINITY_DN11862_c4_g1_i1.p1 TRINITY_DN11862_c4_g1~~TRINITY_DN11862_c4_g1_i1.p1  ORF type:complete len:375 (-),score=95.61 TRINITY_DN11862_c4_g1_i1:148-1272(-)